MNQEQRINEVAGKVMDLLDSHEMDADIIYGLPRGSRSVVDFSHWILNH